MTHQGLEVLRSPVAWPPPRTASVEAHHNHDHRSALLRDRRRRGAVMTLAGVAALAFVLGLFIGPDRTTADGVSATPLLPAQLDASGLAAALLLAALCVVHWRLFDEAALLWLGMAAATYGLFTLGLGYLDAVSVASGNDGILLLYPAGRLVACALAVRALLSPDVQATLHPAKIVLGTAVAVATVTVALQLMPTVARLVTSTAETGVLGWPPAPAASVGVTGVWLGLGLWSLWRGRQRWYVLSWFGLLFLTLGLAEVVDLVAVGETWSWPAGPALLRLIGLLLAVYGAIASLARAYVDQGSQLLESVISEQSVKARIEAESATHAERAHEARNALAAIEGATRTLQRHHDQLDEHARAELAEAVSAEVQRLQQLITADPVPQPNGRFRLTEALAAVVTSARSQGLSITVDVPDHLVAVGHPADTAQAVHNLFQNARRYAGGDVRVSAALAGEHVELTVSDNGPGIPANERDAIFVRGRRGSTAADEPGSGLGLYIASKLLRQQNGGLRVEDSTSGGAAFVVTLPGFSELSPDTAGGERQCDDAGGESPEVIQRSVLPFPVHRGRSAGRVDDEEEGGRHDLAR